MGGRPFLSNAAAVALIVVFQTLACSIAPSTATPASSTVSPPIIKQTQQECEEFLCQTWWNKLEAPRKAQGIKTVGGFECGCHFYDVNGPCKSLTCDRKTLEKANWNNGDLGVGSYVLAETANGQCTCKGPCDGEACGGTIMWPDPSVPDKNRERDEL
mmetsp:Transcript_13020/g.47583  ORF Transcript_13020/g.47583 Transcript_13020/m.47583 type:complete len:158 (+) Transcript_13020:185-658(+)